MILSKKLAFLGLFGGPPPIFFGAHVWGEIFPPPLFWEEETPLLRKNFLKNILERGWCIPPHRGGFFKKAPPLGGGPPGGGGKLIFFSPPGGGGFFPPGVLIPPRGLYFILGPGAF